ncbi:MAG TPA: GNAT family N-acetyltransferase [Proteobacteria bacterium]|nr:GNAT family N-acetyltransferase [Pseudomonadota bacterium]
MGIYNLDKLFTPGAVAVVEACGCGSQGKAEQLFANLKPGAWPVYLIGPAPAASASKPPEPGFRALTEIPEPPPLVVSLLSLAQTPELVDLCGRLGVAALIIMTGKGSRGDDRHEAETIRRAKKNRLRLLGFNSLGMVVPARNFNVSLFEIPVQDGGIALLSQSGAVISSILGRAAKRGIGFSHVVSLGALSDIDFGDMIDYLGWSAKVSCILLYIENLKDVKKFMSACRSVARIKPIVAIRVGKSELGREVIRKHTGCPAGEDRVYDTAFRRAGIIRVETVEELLDAGDHLVRGRLPRGRRLGIISNSGGLGVLAVDGLACKGISVSALSPGLGEKIGRYISPYSGNLDPICIAADADDQRYLKVIDLCLEAAEFDLLLVIMVHSQWLEPMRLVPRIKVLPAAAEVNLLFVWLGGDPSSYEVSAQALTDARTKICFSVEEAVLSCHYAFRYHEKLSNLVVIPQRYSRELGYDRTALDEARRQVEKWLAAGVSRLDSATSRQLLELYGLPVNPVRRFSSLAEILARAQDFSYPVVLKLDSGNSFFKSDRGGVLLNLRSREAVIEAAVRLLQRLEKDACQSAAFTLEAMVENVDYEINLGSRWDVEFGPYLFIGSGGLQARVAAAEEVILPPLDRQLAGKLISRTKLSECSRIRPFTQARLEEILMRVSQMVVDLPELAELILHPLTIAANDFRIVDAKITLVDRDLRSPHHLSTIPYPNQYEFTETLKDGTRVLIRPIKPEDAAAHHEMISGFSRQTRYFRFFSFREEITPEQMARFTQIDYDRDVAIIAQIEREGKKISIGVNRLIYYPHSEEYEFAVVVTDAWQGSGVGRLLMEKLIYIARDRGIKEIFGLVLRNNVAMMRFVKGFGFEIVESEEDLFRIRLQLS